MIGSNGPRCCALEAAAGAAAEAAADGGKDACGSVVRAVDASDKARCSWPATKAAAAASCLRFSAVSKGGSQLLVSGVRGV